MIFAKERGKKVIHISQVPKFGSRRFGHNEYMYIVLGASESGAAGEFLWEAVTVADGREGSRRTVPESKLGQFVHKVEDSNRPTPIRWVWADSRQIMPLLLEQGISPERSHDLRLIQRILSIAATHSQSRIAFAPTLDLLQESLEKPSGMLPPARQIQGQDSLFDDDFLSASKPDTGQQTAPTASQLAVELQTQLRAIEAAPHPRRLKLLAAAESTGGMIAAEMKFHGMPWNKSLHEKLLVETLGPRPAPFERPAEMEKLATEIREKLATPKLNVDSPQELLRALQSAGIRVKSTSKWALKGWTEENSQLAQQRRSLIEPLLAYKKLARLFTANGWNWLDEWVQDDRFHPSYEVGGVVTGRWGAHGGGAMQIPRDVRTAVAAEPGKMLVVADASQVEPRILAAMSGDEKLALAGRGTDLYLGIAKIGEHTGSALNERAQAKIALLGAMYGATTGESGKLLPHLRTMFPQAIEFTERAARVGEQGGQVSTYLGRVSPAPSSEWFERQRRQATAEDERAALAASRSWGRFTRNFVVQGTAAEWALCWMAQIRQKLRATTLFGKPLQSQLVYFLHDEIIIYGPEREAALCEQIVRDAAQAAGEVLFGHISVEFPVTIAVTDNYSTAK